MTHACPIYLEFGIFAKLRARADVEGTSPSFLAMRILRDALGAPESIGDDERDLDAPSWQRRR